MIEYILNPQFVEALGWTLLHSLWQGAIFAISLALILIALRSYTSVSRYVVATGLLTAFFVTVSTTFYLQLQEANSRFDQSTANYIMPIIDDVFVLDNNTEIAMHKGVESSRAQANSDELLTTDESHWLSSFSEYYERHLPLLVTIWLLGVLFLQLRFLGQLAYVQRLKHYGTQLFPESWSSQIEELEGKLRIQKKLKYLTSIRAESPMVIGWLKPVVLLPSHLLKSLSETEIYAVLAHELAHIRREDFIVNLMQTFLCNVFFFHPGVWWMSNRVDDEREHCCDDLAVAATGQASSYAKTLINVSELQLTMQGNAAPLAMAFGGKTKKRERGGFAGRIRRLFMVSNGAGTFREGFATACILMLALFIGVITTGQTVQASEQASLTEYIENAITPEAETSNAIETNSINDTTRIIDGRKISSRTEPPVISEISNETEPAIVIQDFSEPNPPINNQFSNRTDLPVSNKISLRTEPSVMIVLPEAIVPVVEVADSRIDALVMACREGDFDFVQTLIESGIEINGIGTEGFTPLMMATSENHAKIVEYLLEKGADVNQISRGWTALIEAADEGSLASMKFLLKAGADVNYYAEENAPTAITMAASEGHVECLKLLLKNGADINGIEKSMPPLHIAAEEGKQNVIEYLISQGVQINKQDAEGRTALMFASYEGKDQVVKKLIKAGADISVLDNSGNTAKDYAEEEDQYNALNHLDNKQRPDIHQATIDGYIEKVQQMIEEGADVDSRDNYGRTPLHIASALNHNIDMRVLIDLGANVDAKDSQGRTPLMYAAADGKKNAVVFLVSKLADVNIQDGDGMSAYEWSKSSGDKDVARFLGLITESETRGEKKSNQIDENEKSTIKELEKTIQRELKKKDKVHKTATGLRMTHYGTSPNQSELVDAIYDKDIYYCRYLINEGAKVNPTDGNDLSPLMTAVRIWETAIAKLLIEKGADVNFSTGSGLTALHLTALDNNSEMAQILLKNNAKLDLPMRYSSTDGSSEKNPLIWEYIGATPLLIAIESGNIQLVKILLSAGANPDHQLIKNEYSIKKGRETYLSFSEVAGIDEDFLENTKLNNKDRNWTPYKQALQMNDPAMLALFPKHKK